MTTTHGRLEQAAPMQPSPGTAGEGASEVAAGHPRAVVLAWFVGAMAIVLAGYGLVASRHAGFFLVDDTESAILPMFSHLGAELREGTWPWVTERNWTMGLVAGDPQYAIFNPLSLALYWLVEPLDSLQWRIFVIVVVYVLMLAAAVFWAARSLRSSGPFAALAAVTVGLNVYVLYWLAAGWVTLLPGLSWFAVAMAALLAALDRPDRPWRSVIAGLAAALMLTAGNPFVVLAYGATVVIVMAAKYWGRLADARREASLLVAALASGAVLGAVPWIVATAYIPYTRRISGWYNDGFLTFHLESLLMSFSPSVRPFTGTFQGWKYLDQPVAYGSWLFAAAVAIAWTRRVRLRSVTLGVAIAGGTLLVATIGPERLGPFRWPSRHLPFAVALLTLAMVVILEHAAASPERDPGHRRRQLLIAGAVLTALSFMFHPGLVAPLGTAAVLFAGVPLVLWCVRHGHATALAVGGLASTLAIWSVIVLANPATTDLIDLGGPGDIGIARDELRPLSGHRTVQLLESIPAGDISTVLANAYSLHGADEAEVINGYTSLVPEGLGTMLCVKDTGYVCPDAPARLFRREPETGLRYIDLLGVSQVMIQRGPLLDSFEQARSPEWQQAAEAEWWVMYQNGTALGESPVVWTSEGGTVERDGTTELVSLPDGGRIVLSRPLWPGTTVSVGGVDAELDPVGGVFVGATFDEPVAGELEIGHVLPGRTPAIAAAVLGTVMLAACAVAAAVISSRRRRDGSLHVGPRPEGP